MGERETLRRVNEAVAVLLLVVAAAWVVMAPADGFDPALLPFAVLLWAFLFGVVLLLQWAALAPRRRTPPLPFVRRSLPPSVGLGLAVLVASVVVLREGLLPRPLRLDVLHWYTATQDEQIDARHEMTRRGSIQPATLAGTFLRCEVDCESEGAVCDSFRRSLRCDDHGGGEPGTRAVTTVGIRMEGVADPACYMPLYKEGRIEPTVHVRLRAGSGTTEAVHELRLDGHFERRLLGLASCHLLRTQLGHDAADAVAERMRALVREH